MALAAAPSFAEDGRVQNVASSASAIQFYADADTESSGWVADRPDRVAVAVRYGGGTQYSPELIEDIIRSDLTENGISDPVFFWEHGLADGGTGITIDTDDQTFGPFALGTVRNEIPQVSRQIKFNRGVDFARVSLGRQ